jgi:arylsulfatase A-like enzyme
MVLGSLLLGCCQAAPAVPAPAAAAPTRVVLITLDTVRADLLGCYGDKRGITPNLDALAARGVRFARAVAPMPETIPSHAALLTGRSPLSHGTTSNYLALSEEVKTAAELLSDAGVATGAFFHVMSFDEQHVTQGFATAVLDKGAAAAAVAPRAFEWLDAQPADKPAFAWLHYYVAHAPFEPPAELAKKFWTGKYDGPLGFDVPTIFLQNQSPTMTPPAWIAAVEERYAAEVAFVDQRVGEVVAALRERGQLEKTLLVVVADHGESFRAGTVAQHSLSTREQTMRVPLIVAGPGVPAGGVVERWVMMTDLFATLLKPFAVAPPEGSESRDLGPLLRGEEVEWDDVAFGSLPVPIEKHQAGKLPDVFVAWSGRWKLLVVDVNGKPRGVLRDLETDPDEAKDCSKEHLDVVAGLEKRVRAWVDRQRKSRLEPGAVDEAVRAQLDKLGYGNK